MEGEMKSTRIRRLWLLVATAFLAVFFAAPAMTQERPAAGKEEERAQLHLRKTPLKKLQYKGRAVEGEEKVITRGDSLWRILIQEKGLSEKRFSRYLVIIGALNPHVKKPNILQVGQTIFIPIRPDEILGIEVPTGKGEAGETKIYRVKQGDYLFKILREQFNIQEKKEIRNTFEQVKELNPGKKNWNFLFTGEGILFPGSGKLAAVPAAVEPAKPVEIVGLDYGRKLPVRENMQLLEQVMAALGNETQRGGEEVLALQEGSIRIDRDSYPVIRNPKVEQKVILDTEGKIPPSLRSKLEGQGSAAQVVSVKKGDSLHDTVSNLLARLGFQSLPSNRPVEIQDGGVGLQVKGEWMVAAPEESGGRQEVLIINLTDDPGRTPDYLKDYLSLKGMSLKEILIPSSPFPRVPAAPAVKGQEVESRVESWPREKGALVDALLKSYEISFSSGEQLSVPLREGIRLDAKIDRRFEIGGKKVALFFRAVGEELKRALQEREGLRVIEIDLAALSSRELIARLLEFLGEKTAYREHRFSATEGGAKDKIVLSLAGFFLVHRSLFLTDRAIPAHLQKFFGEKGLRVVYFQ